MNSLLSRPNIRPSIIIGFTSVPVPAAAIRDVARNAVSATA